jgi:hypothetical protein
MPGIYGENPWEWERNRYFVLVDKIAVPSTFQDWCLWSATRWDSGDRIVAYTKTDIVEVSTVFLGINHNFNFNADSGPPLLFETMAFHKLDAPKKLLNLEVEWDGQETMRCSTWEEAEIQHRVMVAEVISKEYLGTREQLSSMVETVMKDWERR